MVLQGYETILTQMSQKVKKQNLKYMPSAFLISKAYISIIYYRFVKNEASK